MEAQGQQGLLVQQVHKVTLVRKDWQGQQVLQGQQAQMEVQDQQGLLVLLGQQVQQVHKVMLALKV